MQWGIPTGDSIFKDRLRSVLVVRVLEMLHVIAQASVRPASVGSFIVFRHSKSNFCVGGYFQSWHGQCGMKRSIIDGMFQLASTAQATGSVGGTGRNQHSKCYFHFFVN